MFRKAAVLVCGAILVNLVAIGCGSNDGTTTMTGPIAEAPAPDDSSSGPRLPLELSPKWAYAVEPCIEGLEATAWGHSCATFSPKEKAKDKAVEAAKEILAAYYDSHTTIAGNPCGDGDDLSGNWFADEVVTVLEEVKKRTDGCGWDVKVKLRATVCSRCST